MNRAEDELIAILEELAAASRELGTHYQLHARLAAETASAIRKLNVPPACAAHLRPAFTTMLEPYADWLAGMKVTASNLRGILDLLENPPDDWRRNPEPEQP